MITVFTLYHESAIHDRDLHMLRMAVLFYHELAVHDHDLHMLRMAVLFYHESAEKSGWL